MTATELRPTFRRRFRGLVRRMWALHVGRGLALTVLVAAAAVAASAGLDFVFELPRPARAALLAVTLAGVVLLALRWVARPAVAWNRARVAAELEGLFPRLGQRLRTTDEHAGRPADELSRAGVSPGLVAALEAETAEKAKPLPFQAALPVRPTLFAGAAAVAAVALLAVPAVPYGEWRTALERTALTPATYTQLSAAASADSVVEGADVDIRATLAGRARPNVTLFVRDVGETDWREEAMDAADGGFTARLTKLRRSVEFYVAAGPERTDVQRVAVRHNLKLVSARAEVTSPAYTGVPVARHDSGSFSAVQGSTARLRFELDRQPASAALMVSDATKPKEPARRVEVWVKGRTLSAELPLTHDIEYTIDARADDGMPMAANKHRVRVTADQPPTVTFDTPAEAIEVHTLAEVLMRARAKDDFGVSRVGIVFQVNNEEERTLIVHDVTQPHQREAKAEQILQLEQFLLTQKDCVAYYAFAEDNRPDAPNRTTTELRFIDIRPFKRTYRLIDLPDEPGMGPQRELIFLDEVIARQRFNLNRSMRLETRAKVKLDLAEVEKVAAFENKLATQTHDLADFLAGLGVDGAAILSQAEEAMLSAVDSLNGAKFGTAVNQERDALRFLMEARDTLQLSLPKQTRSARAQARAFDRLQRQKLRRENEKAETLPQIADELARLANEEDDLARMLAGGTNPGGQSGKGGDPKAEPMPMANGKDEKPMPTEGGDKPEKPAGPGGKTGEKKPGKGGDDPAFEKQEEIAGRAAALEKVAATAKGLTGLAKNRIGEAAKAANEAADELGKGDREAARPKVDKARETFRTAAKQVAALAAAEAAQQLAAARDLANEIAQQAAPPDPDRNTGSGGMGEGKVPGLGSAAEQAKSLKDVLENLAGSGSEADAEAAKKAGGILKQEDLAAAIARLEKPGAGGDKEERRDLAERFAALGQKLDQAYREAVAPRLEEIAKLEREAAELEQKAAGGDDGEWRRAERQGRAFVEKLEAAGLGALADGDLRAGLAGGAGGRETFGRGIAAVHTRLVAKLQEFVAGDVIATGNEPVPPEYKELVERYLRALSAGGTK